MKADIPPAPADDAPTDREQARRALRHAGEALRLASAGLPGAQRAFLRSWHQVLASAAAQAEEDENRRRAWDEVERLEAVLQRMAEVANDTESTPERKLPQIRALLRQAGAETRRWTDTK